MEIYIIYRRPPPTFGRTHTHMLAEAVKFRIAWIVLLDASVYGERCANDSGGNDGYFCYARIWINVEGETEDTRVTMIRFARIWLNGGVQLSGSPIQHRLNNAQTHTHTYTRAHMRTRDMLSI